MRRSHVDITKTLSITGAQRRSVRNSYTPVYDPTTFAKPAAPEDEGPKRETKHAKVEVKGPFALLFWDVNSDSFQLLSGFITILNAFVIGLETDTEPESFIPFEIIFCLYFWLEIIMRLLQSGGFKDWVTDSWNLFDAVIVLSGSAELFVLPAMVAHSASGSGARAVLKVLQMARILRLLRLFRLALLHDLIFMMTALKKAFSVVMWVGVLTLIIDYICSIFITTVVGHNAGMWGASEPEISYWFGSVLRTIRTLFIIMTLADWDDIADVLSEQLPASVVFSFAVFYILIVSYAMVSLITGVISESLITAQNEDHNRKLAEIEKGRAALFGNLKHLLTSLDTDGSGSLERSEIEQALKSQRNLFTQLSALDIDTDMDRLLELYDRLDQDFEVTIELFVEALSQLAGNATSSAVFDLKHLHMVTRKELNSNQEEQLAFIRKIHSEFADFRSIVQQDLGDIHAKMQLR